MRAKMESTATNRMIELVYTVTRGAELKESDFGAEVGGGGGLGFVSQQTLVVLSPLTGQQ